MVPSWRSETKYMYHAARLTTLALLAIVHSYHIVATPLYPYLGCDMYKQLAWTAMETYQGS